MLTGYFYEILLQYVVLVLSFKPYIYICDLQSPE